MARRLIDAEALKKFYGKWSNKHTEFLKAEVDAYIDAQPTIDAVEVVCCRECKRQRKEGCIDTVWCGKWGSPRLPDDYCSYGVRREPDDD